MSVTLRKKISKKQATIAVIGLGYVGLPLALSFAKAGFKVVGIDKDVDRVNRLRRKESYILDIPSKEISSLIDKGTFKVSLDFRILKSIDVILICVPTPLKRKYTPDISFILKCVKEIRKHLKKDTLVICESTTYPGTTEEVILPELEKSKLKVGQDFFLSFSPERIDPGNKKYSVTKIPKVVGGITETCGDLTKAFYAKVIANVHLVSSAKVAEMTKLLENSFRIVNIGWINEIAMMCNKMGIDSWEVIDAAKTKPFGFMPFYPGLGVGGHCIPDDPLYLYWKAKKFGFNPRFLKLSADINRNMPEYVVDRLSSLLKSDKKTLEKSKILIVGATYKKDVKDLRKSPALKLIELLKGQKAKVSYYDPIIPYLKIGILDMKSIKLSDKNLIGYDCVIIAVDHTDVDYSLIRRSSQKIFDLKNVYKRVKDKRIIKL